MSVESFAAMLEHVRGDILARGRLRRRLAAPLVLEHVGDDDASAYELVGELFALYASTTPPKARLSLGVAYGRLIEAVPVEGATDGLRGGYQQRMRGLLDGVRDTLEPHLRHAVGICEQRGQALDYAVLLEDVLHWDDEDRHVQQRLASEVWGDAAATYEYRLTVAGAQVPRPEAGWTAESVERAAFEALATAAPESTAKIRRRRGLSDWKKWREYERGEDGRIVRIDR